MHRLTPVKLTAKIADRVGKRQDVEDTTSAIRDLRALAAMRRSAPRQHDGSDVVARLPDGILVTTRPRLQAQLERLAQDKVRQELRLLLSEEGETSSSGATGRGTSGQYGSYKRIGDVALRRGCLYQEPLDSLYYAQCLFC